MPKLESNFWGRFDWRFNPSRRTAKNSNKSEPCTQGNSPASEPNKREDSNKDESGYKRMNKNYKCPTEPFRETLRLIEELF